MTPIDKLREALERYIGSDQRIDADEYALDARAALDELAAERDGLRDSVERFVKLEVQRLEELRADADKAGNCYGDPVLTLLELIEMVELEQRGNRKPLFRIDVARSALDLLQARSAKHELRAKGLESQLSAQPKALEWRKLDPAKDCGEPMLFRMPIVSNGKPDVDYWVDTVREREEEDEIGGVSGVYYDLTEDHGWDISLVEAEALCIPLSALPLALKGGSDDEPPYVCPGCHAVAEPCLPGCIDAEIEAEQREAIESGNYDRSEEDDD